MILWLRIRRLSYILTISITSIILAICIGNSPIPLIGLFRGFQASVPLGVFLPTLIAISTAVGLNSDMILFEKTSYRPIKIYDTIYIFVICLMLHSICIFIYLVSKNSILIVFSRNTIGYIGFVLISKSLVGINNSAILTVSFVVIISIFGVGRSNHPYWWAWPLVMPEYTKYWGLSWIIIIIITMTGLLLNLIDFDFKRAFYRNKSLSLH